MGTQRVSAFRGMSLSDGVFVTNFYFEDHFPDKNRKFVAALARRNIFYITFKNLKIRGT